MTRHHDLPGYTLTLIPSGPGNPGGPRSPWGDDGCKDNHETTNEHLPIHHQPSCVRPTLCARGRRGSPQGLLFMKESPVFEL